MKCIQSLRNLQQLWPRKAVTFRPGELYCRGWQYLHFGPLVRYVPRRGMSKTSFYPGNKMVPEYKKDRVPEGFEFIYCKGNIRYFTIGIPAFLITSLVTGGVVAYVFKVSQDKENAHKRQKSTFSQSDSIELFCLFAAVFLPAFTLFFIRMTKNIMLRMYYNESTNKYYAVLLRYGVYRKAMHFGPEEIVVKPKPERWTNITIQGHNCLVHETDFTNMKMFNRFMSSDLSKESEFLRNVERENLEVLLQTATDKFGKEADKEFVKKFLQKRKERREARETKERYTVKNR